MVPTEQEPDAGADCVGVTHHEDPLSEEPGGEITECRGNPLAAFGRGLAGRGEPPISLRRPPKRGILTEHLLVNQPFPVAHVDLSQALVGLGLELERLRDGGSCLPGADQGRCHQNIGPEFRDRFSERPGLQGAEFVEGDVSLTMPPSDSVPIGPPVTNEDEGRRGQALTHFARTLKSSSTAAAEARSMLSSVKPPICGVAITRSLRISRKSVGGSGSCASRQ